MSLIVLIINQLIHQHFMKMSEIFVKCIFINDYDIKLIKIYYIIEVCMIVNIFSMHRIIFVSVRLLLGSQPTCQPDQKGDMADHALFSNSKHFFV